MLFLLFTRLIVCKLSFFLRFNVGGTYSYVLLVMATPTIKSILKNNFTPSNSTRTCRNVRFSDILAYSNAPTPDVKRKLVTDSDSRIEDEQTPKKTRFVGSEENKQPDSCNMTASPLTTISAKKVMTSLNSVYKDKSRIPRLIVGPSSEQYNRSRRRRAASGATIIIKRLQYDDSFSPLRDVNFVGEESIRMSPLGQAIPPSSFEICTLDN